MNTTEKQPVAEQPSDEKSLEVSDNSANESPAASSNTADNNSLDSKVDIDYLGSSLFSDIKEISPEDLNQSIEVEEVSPEQERYLSTFSDISEREIISGRVIGINEKEVLIDIGFKSEGIITRDEFSMEDLPEVGGKIDVYLERMEDESGKTVLSKEKADFLRRWIELRDIHDTGEIIKGTIVKRINPSIKQIKKLCSKILDISLSFFAPSASAIKGVIA